MTGLDRRSTARLPGLLSLTLLTALLGCGASGSHGDEPATALPFLEIAGTRVDLELARSPEEQIQGLSDRPELDWGRGLLFQYSTPRRQRFWMRRMRFSIDIVWIRERRIVEIHQRLPIPEEGTLDSELMTYSSGEPVDAVLEVPAGFSEAHGWRRGQLVKLSPDAAL